MIAFLVVLLGIQSVLGENCPNPEVVQNFDAAAYLGKWYEQEKYPVVFEANGKCNTAEYSLNDDGTVRVHNTMVLTNGSLSSIVGKAEVTSKTGQAKLLVTFYDPVTVHSPYWVLSTDYETYSVVYSCKSILGIKIDFAWILTREQNPSEDLIKKAYSVFEDRQLSTKLLTKTDQKTCN